MVKNFEDECPPWCSVNKGPSSPLLPRFRLRRALACLTGQEGDPCTATMGTQYPSPVSCWHLPHLSLSQATSPSSVKSAPTGSLVLSYAPELSGTSEESLASDANATARRAAKTTPVPPGSRAIRHSRSNTATGIAGAGLGTWRTVAGSALFQSFTEKWSKACTSIPTRKWKVRREAKALVADLWDLYERKRNSANLSKCFAVAGKSCSWKKWENATYNNTCDRWLALVPGLKAPSALLLAAWYNRRLSAMEKKIAWALLPGPYNSFSSV